MDLSAVIVIVLLTGLSIGAIVWMEMKSRKNKSGEHRSNTRSSEIGGE